MHVVVREKEGKNVNIRLPNGVVFNALTAKIAEKVLANTNGAPQLTAAQLRRLFRELKRSHRLLRARDMHLVEVSEKDGDYVLVDF